MKSLLTSIVACLICGPAIASSFTGTVQSIVVQGTSSGGTRVSVLTSGITVCSTAGAFAFEFAGPTGPGTSWLAGLYAAKATGETIAIYGTGTCDQYSVEVLNYIYFN